MSIKQNVQASRYIQCITSCPNNSLFDQSFVHFEQHELYFLSGFVSKHGKIKMRWNP